MKDNQNWMIWGFVGVLIVGLVGYVVFTQVPDSPSDTISDTEYVDEEISEIPDTGVTMSDIKENPDLYLGTEVTLRGEVEQWLNPRAILFDTPGVINDKLLVITKEPTYIFEDPEMFGDSIWEVNGTVERFVLATAIDTYDADLKPDLFSIFEGQPFIVADSVTLFED